MAELSAAASGTFTIGEDLTVTRLGFGAMRVTGKGVWGPPKDHDGAIRVLRRAADLGIDFIDTADSYGPYVSEELIAEALHPYPASLVIATKAGFDRPGPDRWMQEEGKIKHIGLSEVSVAQIEHARTIVPIVSVQNRYSVSDRAAEDVLEYCERENIGFIPWFPLGAGKLAEPGGALARAAADFKISTAQLALAWLLWRSPVMLPIPGTSSVAHLEENVATAALKLEERKLRDLGKLTQSAEA